MYGSNYPELNGVPLNSQLGTYTKKAGTIGPFHPYMIIQKHEGAPGSAAYAPAFVSSTPYTSSMYVVAGAMHGYQQGQQRQVSGTPPKRSMQREGRVQET